MIKIEKIEALESDGLRTLYRKGKATDFPYDEIVPAMARHSAEGKLIMVKYTCSHCRKRVRGPINDWSPTQTCPACGKEHDFEKSGGNYATSELINPDGKYKTSLDAQRAFDKAHPKL